MVYKDIVRLVKVEETGGGTAFVKNSYFHRGRRLLGRSVTVHDECAICVAQLKSVYLDINRYVEEMFIKLRQRDLRGYKIMTGGNCYSCGLIGIAKIVGSQVKRLSSIDLYMTAWALTICSISKMAAEGRHELHINWWGVEAPTVGWVGGIKGTD